MKHFARNLLVCTFLVFVLLAGVGHADNRGDYSHGNRDILSTGEKIVLDAIVLRPIGLLTTVAGTAIYTVSLPFSLLGGNEAEVREHLINQPARYTFKRPLGDVDY